MSASMPQVKIPTNRSIILVGMMGVGKSSVGKRLAKRLGMPFFDADDEIEAAAGMTIAEMFERYNEEYFRDGERRVIARLIEGQAKIVATGGGAFVNDDTRALIKQKALSVWLDADIEILVERVARRSHRPLLHGKDTRAVLTELSLTRNPVYAQADIHIRSDASPHAATVDSIMKALEA